MMSAITIITLINNSDNLPQQCSYNIILMIQYLQSLSSQIETSHESLTCVGTDENIEFAWLCSIDVSFGPKLQVSWFDDEVHSHRFPSTNTHSSKVFKLSHRPSITPNSIPYKQHGNLFTTNISCILDNSRDNEWLPHSNAVPTHFVIRIYKCRVGQTEPKWEQWCRVDIDVRARIRDVLMRIIWPPCILFVVVQWDLSLWP